MQAGFFKRLGSNSIPVLSLTQGQKCFNSVDNPPTQNTGAEKRDKILIAVTKSGKF